MRAARLTLLAPVRPGLTKPPTTPHAVCPGCLWKHRVSGECRVVYCDCGVRLLLDWRGPG